MTNFTINLLELYKPQQKLQHAINIFVEKLLTCFSLTNGRKDPYCSLVVEVNDIDKIFQPVFSMNCHIFRPSLCMSVQMDAGCSRSEFCEMWSVQCSCFSCSSRKVTKSATDITSKDGQNRILACKFSPSWRYFAACDDAKRLYLFQCGERWELVSNRYVEFSEVR